MSKVYTSAVALLARREHGVHELTQKLLKKGHSLHDIEETLSECQRLGLQSDRRYAESLCRTRIQQGYGPRRIANELQQMRIEREIIAQVLAQEEANWINYALDAWRKKYKTQDLISIPKQKQFLLYRGFTMDVVNQVLKCRSEL